MAPKILHFIRKFFRTSWKTQLQYGHTLTRGRRSNCVLKSVSSKSSLTGTNSSCSDGVRHACSISSINFEFRADPDPCCARKCCKKCFCEEGEALAECLRKSKIDSDKGSGVKKTTQECTKKKCFCLDVDTKVSCCKTCCCPVGSLGSLDSACDVTSASSCDDVNCEYRSGSVGVTHFIEIHAAAFADPEYETLTPKYENVPNSDSTYDQVKESLESPYDSIPPRPPRAVSEPRYENVLNINCIDACVFREISALVEATTTPAQMVESLQQLHLNYSCVRRTSSADNEINYYFENYEELDNDLNSELEKRLSD